MSWPAALDVGTRVTYPRGARLFRQGDEVRNIHIVAEGLVLLCDENDGASRLLGLCAKGRPLDAIAAVLGARHLATAVAVTDCSVIHLENEYFQRLRTDQSNLGCWLQTKLAEEAGEHQERWAQVSPAGSLDGMVWILVRCFRVAGRERADGSIQMLSHISVTALAEWLNVTRQTASQYLNDLKRRGVVDIRSDWLVLPRSSPIRSRVLKA